MMPIGYKHSEETRRKIAIKLRGNTNGLGNKSNTGRKLAKETIEKIREANRGETNYLWKGENVSYSGLHHWMKREYGKASRCENPECIYPRVSPQGRLLSEAKRFTWANKSGEYKRNKEDWYELCYSCHKLFDLGKLSFFKK